MEICNIAVNEDKVLMAMKNCMNGVERFYYAAEKYTYLLEKGVRDYRYKQIKDEVEDVQDKENDKMTMIVHVLSKYGYPNKTALRKVVEKYSVITQNVVESLITDWNVLVLFGLIRTHRNTELGSKMRFEIGGEWFYMKNMKIVSEKKINVHSNTGKGKRYDIYYDDDYCCFCLRRVRMARIESIRVVLDEDDPVELKRLNKQIEMLKKLSALYVMQMQTQYKEKWDKKIEKYESDHGVKIEYNKRDLMYLSSFDEEVVERRLRVENVYPEENWMQLENPNDVSFFQTGHEEY